MSSSPASPTPGRSCRQLGRLGLAGRLVSRLAPAVLALGQPLPSRIAAQGVVVVPQTIVFARGERRATMELVNTGAAAMTVTVTPAFGHPVSDSAGEVHIVTTDAPPPGAPSAVPWTSVFPRTMTVAPGMRQTVRLQVRPPAGLPDGEYWARLMVVSRPAAEPSADGSGGAASSAPVEVEQLVAVFYRQGPQTTGLEHGPPTISVAEGRLRLRAAFERRGTAAFLGTCTVSLRAADGRTVRTMMRRLAVYDRLSPAFELDVRELPAGEYQVLLEVTTERDDLGPGEVVRAPAVRDSASVVLPGAPPVPIPLPRR